LANSLRRKSAVKIQPTHKKIPTFTDTEDYRKFATGWLVKSYESSGRQVNADNVRKLINQFYEYVDKYEDYAAKLTHHQGSINESKYPDYDYAARMSGLYRETVQNMERAYKH
jgi:hypothetical protein